MRNEPINNPTNTPDKVEKRPPEGITTRSPLHNFVRGAFAGAGLNAVNEYSDKIKAENEAKEDFQQQQQIDAQKERNAEAAEDDEDDEEGE